jgi:hypothetical protein
LFIKNQQQQQQKMQTERHVKQETATNYSKNKKYIYIS